MSSYSFYYEAL